MKEKESIAAKKRIVAVLLKGNDVRRDSPFARYIEHDVDMLYREFVANNETRKAIERARNRHRDVRRLSRELWRIRYLLISANQPPKE